MESDLKSYMRIISGKSKGKKINFLKTFTTRPLKDSVRESIFNIITHSNLFNINLEKTNVLDLYSGFGSFGLECLSRGANNITFIEKDKAVAKILKKNLISLSSQEKAIVIINEIEQFLDREKLEKFEIIFLDPPFKENTYLDVLKNIKKKKIFKKNHIVIIHREKRSSDNLNNILTPLIIKQYGRSKIIFGKFLS